MKRIFIAVAFLLFAVPSYAVDVCVEDDYDESSDGGQFTAVYTCTLDNSNTGYATYTGNRMTRWKGAITSVEGKQGANPNFPNALVVDFQTANGTSLPGFPAASITGSAGAAAWILAPGAENPIPYMGLLQILFTTNTTTGAIIEITIQGLLF